MVIRTADICWMDSSDVRPPKEFPRTMHRNLKHLRRLGGSPDLGVRLRDLVTSLQ